MSIKKSGMWCDICGSPIMGAWWSFGVEGMSPEVMHCHEACKKPLEGSVPLRDRMHDLPEGPFRRALFKGIDRMAEIRRTEIKPIDTAYMLSDKPVEEKE